MKHFLSAIIALVIMVPLYGQNNARIQGSVYDAEQQPLTRATVSLVTRHDSLVVSYGLTDGQGKFDLVRLPTEKDLLLFISHVNSAVFKKEIRLQADQTLRLDSISLSGQTIAEVVVEAVAPIRLNGDTLEYKADYFKTRPNASVEELLRLLPGLQVNVDGSIFYQGKQVQGIRVNNRDFFAQDLTIATRNLDASLIDIVQVIKDKGETKREILDDSDLPIVLNLKMKREFLKADFGKVYAGAANRDRYESGVLLNTFRDTLQISFIGFGNNINRQGFDYSELSQYGGYNRGENMNYTMYGTDGLMNRLSGGLNINYDVEKKLKTNLMYNYNQVNWYTDNEIDAYSFYDDVQEQSQSKSNSQTNNFEHKLRGFARYHMDTTAHISYDATLSAPRNTGKSESEMQSWRGPDQPVSEGGYDGNRNNRRSSYTHRVIAEKKFPNKWLLSLNHSYSSNSSNGETHSLTRSRYYLFNDSVIHQQEMMSTQGKGFGLQNRMNLQIPLGENVNFDVFTTLNLEQNGETQDINNRINSDYFTNRNDIANDRSLRSLKHEVGSRWNIKLIKDLPISVGLTWLNLKNHFDYYGKRENKTDWNQYWLPSFSLSYQGMNISYNRNISTPYIYQVVVVDSDLQPTYHTLASPYFDNTIQDAYRIRYQKHFSKPKINFSVSINYTQLSNTIGTARTYDTESSFTTQRAFQTDPAERWSVQLNGSKNFIQQNDWKLSYDLMGYAYIDQQFSRVNGDDAIGNSMYGQISNTINLNYKDHLTFSPIYRINLNQVTFESESDNFQNARDFTHNFGFSFRLDNVKKFRLETAYTLQNEIVGLGNQRDNLHILNASLYYPILGKGEVKLSAFDILDQNISNRFRAYNNVNSHYSTATLRQYFMLGLVYKFLKTGEPK